MLTFSHTYMNTHILMYTHTMKEKVIERGMVVNWKMINRLGVRKEGSYVLY